MKKTQIICILILVLRLFSATAGGQETGEQKLETKTILNNRIEIKLPKEFQVMSEDMAKLKYPAERRPTLIYTNESGRINVAFNLTNNKASQELIESYRENIVKGFKNIYPSADWKGSGVKMIKGKKYGFMELITPTIDTQIYNLIFFTDLDGKLLLCTFNCTKEDIKDNWEITAKEIMNSTKIK
jgi:hypothetical protein